VRDYADVRGTGVVDVHAANAALDLLEIDDLGLDRLDREIPRRDLHEVRRRPGRPLDAGGHRGRGAGHDRGRL
jgi:Holliday junction DNA helicase RuvB